MEDSDSNEGTQGNQPEAPQERTIAKKKINEPKKSAADVKREIFLDVLLNCDHLSYHTIEALKHEEKEKGHLLKLRSAEMEKIWKDLQDLIRDNIMGLRNDTIENKEDCRRTLLGAIYFLQHTALFHGACESESFAWNVAALHLILFDQCTGGMIRNKICELCECCCIKGIRIDEEFYLNTISCLLDLTLAYNSGIDMKADIRRIWDMRWVLAQLSQRVQSCEEVVRRLEKVVTCPAYLVCKQGRQFIAFLLTVNTKLMKKLHDAIKNHLSICSQTQARDYGEVYFTAWMNSSFEVRKELERHCIQNFMYHMFVSQREGTELLHTGENVFVILSYLHNHRTTAYFSKILTQLYMPLMWRHLRSGNNIERCNAALVFLDAYPLETGTGMVEQSAFLTRQHEEMVDLLTDTCHVVRIIGIKGICSKLRAEWHTFPQETIQLLMRTMLELSSDGSDYQVRVALYSSLRDLLLNPQSAAYLMRVLPTVRDNIHDEDEKVRKAFVKLLLGIKEKSSELHANFWEVVPIEHLAVRLQLEKPEVGSLLCKLLMSNIYTPDCSEDVFLPRIIEFVKTNPEAARRLFQYSTQELKYKDAMRIILTIMVRLRAFVRKKLDESNESEEQGEERPSSSSGSKRKKRKTEKLPTVVSESKNIRNDTGGSNSLEDKENSSELSNMMSWQDSTEEGERVRVEDLLGRPEVSHGLVDIVSVLWSLHSWTLAYNDHENLLDWVVTNVPMFLRYFRGTPTYFAVIHLASLVPANKLNKISTVCSMCAARLKALSETTPQEEVDVLVNALCSWNRFGDIQDLVVDWLDHAFRFEGLNQSHVPITRSAKQRKFFSKGGKQMLALRLLDAVFYHPLSKRCVLVKAYDQVYELYTYLHRIKTLVERRLLGGVPFDSPMLNDDFLVKCFFRYTKLVLILHRPWPLGGASDNQSIVEPFDAGEVFEQLVEWASRIILPLLPWRLDDEPWVSVLFMKQLLCTAANLVDLCYADKNTLVKLAGLMKNLLSSECSLWFVEYIMIVVKHMKDYGEAFHGREDNDMLLRTVIPSLLSRAVRSLSKSKYSKEEVERCVENMSELKTSMYEVITCLLRLYGPESQLVQSVLKLFTNAIVSVISVNVKQLQTIDTVDEVQELPFVCGLLLSIVTRDNIVPLWMATVPSSISGVYAKNPGLLAASVSLLHTLAHCSALELPHEEMRRSVREAYRAVSATPARRRSTASRATIGTNSTISPRGKMCPMCARESAITSRASLASQNGANTSTYNESSFSDNSINVKRVAPPILSELAAFLNCTLT